MFKDYGLCLYFLLAFSWSFSCQLFHLNYIFYFEEEFIQIGNLLAYQLNQILGITVFMCPPLHLKVISSVKRQRFFYNFYSCCAFYFFFLRFISAIELVKCRFSFWSFWKRTFRCRQLESQRLPFFFYPQVPLNASGKKEVFLMPLKISIQMNGFLVLLILFPLLNQKIKPLFLSSLIL